MPHTLNFFSSQANSVYPAVGETSASIGELVMLGKQISDSNMLCDNTFFLIEELSEQYRQMKDNHQLLLNQRNFIARQYEHIKQTISHHVSNCDQIIAQTNRAIEEVMQIFAQLKQSQQVYQLLTNSTELGFSVYQQVQPGLKNPEEIIIEFRSRLNNALLAMNEGSPCSVRLTAIIKHLDDFIANAPQMENMQQSFFNEIQRPLIDLTALAERHKQSLDLLMLIKSMVKDKVHREYTNLQGELHRDHQTETSRRHTLSYLTAELVNSQDSLARMEQRLVCQRQLSRTFDDERLNLLNLFKEEQRKCFSLDRDLCSISRAYGLALHNLQPILIQDILVTHPPGLETPENGETLNPIEEECSYLGRMVQQFKLLAQLAKYHHQKNCTPDGRLKTSCKHNITRLITDEFSFYPCEPLTTEAYLYLLRTLEKIAKTLPSNIHLVLASFPVLDINEQLHNTTVHLDTGPELDTGPQPVLHHHSKALHAKEDFNYGYVFAENSAPWAHAQMPQIHFDRPLIFGFGSILYSWTAGRACLMNKLEVCIEHNYNIGLDCLGEELNRAVLADEIIPMQYSHVLTSRTTFINQREANNIRITQADAERPGVWIRDHQSSNFSSYQPSKVLRLDNYFGKSNQVHVYSPQQASYLPEEFFKRAASNNARIIDSQLESRPMASLV